MGVALVSLDVSGGGTYVSLTPFHIGEAGSDGGQTNNNNNIVIQLYYRRRAVIRNSNVEV